MLKVKVNEFFKELLNLRTIYNQEVDKVNASESLKTV